MGIYTVRTSLLAKWKYSCEFVTPTVVIEIIQPPFKFWFIAKIYRLSAVCNKQITNKSKS